MTRKLRRTAALLLFCLLPQLCAGAASLPTSKDDKHISWYMDRPGTYDFATKTIREVLSDRDLGEILRKAEQTNRSTTTGITMSVSLRLLAHSSAVSAEVEIERGYFDKIVENNRVDMSFTTSFGQMSLPSWTLESIRITAPPGNIILRMGRADISKLPSHLQESVGNRPAVEFFIGTPNGSLDKVGGIMSLNFPYTLGAGENKDELRVLKLTEDGPVLVRSSYESYYQPRISLSNQHPGAYAAAYRPLLFSDVRPEDWFSAAALFVHYKGISYDRGDNRFGPDDSLSRGEMVYMLMKAYGLEPSYNMRYSFMDGMDAYYSFYLIGANELGIVEGVGDHRFEPERLLTRQDMCTMLYRALKKLEKLPASDASGGLSGYPDGDRVADYAREAMAALVKAGVVSGYGGKLEPEASTSRAQLSQILYNLLRS